MYNNYLLIKALLHYLIGHRDIFAKTEKQQLAEENFFLTDLIKKITQNAKLRSDPA